MGKARIMVFHLRDLIRTIIFALAGIAVLIVLIYLFIPKNADSGEQNASLYLPGTYISQINLSKQPLNVEVTVSDKEITAIELKNMAEVQEVFYPLVKPAMARIAEEIVKTQSFDVHISEEDVVTSGVLLNAIKDAVYQAKIPSDI